MSASAPRSVLLLGAVASVLLVMIGLVGSTHRAAPRPRANPTLEPWTPSGSRGATLRAPPPEEPSVTAQGSAPEGARSKGPAPAGLSLIGVIVLPDGEPASNAFVVLGKETERAATDGRFELELAPALPDADLVAFQSGFEPAVLPHVRTSAAPSGERELRLVLGPETALIAGTVVDADGRPRKGWAVELDGPDLLRDYGLRENVRTDADGHFVLRDVPVGVHVLCAWKERREQAARSLPVMAGEQGLTIVADSNE